MQCGKEIESFLRVRNEKEIFFLTHFVSEIRPNRWAIKAESVGASGGRKALVPLPSSVLFVYSK